MASCIICQIIEGTLPSKKVYEDDEVAAFLDYNGALEGHVLIAPKEHFPIFEQVPDKIVGHLFNTANRISSALFDGLNIQGTNIFVTNGVSAGQKVPHFLVNVVPRKEGDGINLASQPRQLSEEEMSTTEIRIKEETRHIGIEKESAVKQQEERVRPVDTDNYLWKSVNKKIA